ncbi:MAG: hypothetical protein EOM62_11330 [Bacteroidia bacterium]|nr:hypothetical protein [Bacteroidia bacterium]
MDVISIPSPLEIEHSFFSEIMFQAFPTPEGNDKTMPRSRTAHSHTPVDENGRFQIMLRVASEDEEKTDQLLYRFRISSVGIFRWKDMLPEDPCEKEEFVQRLIVTGLSILYSGTRNMLQTITGSGPYHPPYLLQPATFVPRELPVQKKKPRSNRK